MNYKVETLASFRFKKSNLSVVKTRMCYALNHKTNDGEWLSQTVIPSNYLIDFIEFICFLKEQMMDEDLLIKQVAERLLLLNMIHYKQSFGKYSSHMKDDDIQKAEKLILELEKVS